MLRTAEKIAYMRTHIRIVAGSLRGRKLTCTVNANLRPTPQMVREALFSILGNAVPDRPFIDIFAGTGVIGLEAVSRGASTVTFIERDFRLIGDLERHIDEFGIGQKARIARTDVYRWIERWQAPDEPVTIFLSPPFRDFEHRLDELLNVMAQLQQGINAGPEIPRVRRVRQARPPRAVGAKQVVHRQHSRNAGLGVARVISAGQAAQLAVNAKQGAVHNVFRLFYSQD